jgi:hypothetical protein
MAKRSRPQIVTKDHLDLEAFPGHVQVALAEVARAAREGVLALWSPAGCRSSPRCSPPTSRGSADPRASTTVGVVLPSLAFTPTTLPGSDDEAGFVGFADTPLAMTTTSAPKTTPTATISRHFVAAHFVTIMGVPP